MKKLSSRTLLAAINCFILTASFLAVADVRVFFEQENETSGIYKKGQLFKDGGGRSALRQM
jgi:hypothetical protein